MGISPLFSRLERVLPVFDPALEGPGQVAKESILRKWSFASQDGSICTTRANRRTMAYA